MLTWIIRRASLGACLQVACSSAAPGIAPPAPLPTASTVPPTEGAHPGAGSAATEGSPSLSFPPFGVKLANEPVWWRDAPTAQHVGNVSFSLLGAALSDQPGAAPHAICRGAPALIVDVRSHAQEPWARVLGADGSVGWVRWPRAATSQPAALVAPSGKWDLASAATGPDSPDVEHTEAAGPVARIVGAAAAAAVARMDHLGIEPDHNVALAPWLEVEVGDTRGFVPGFEYALAWQAAPISSGELPLRGLVQCWFWADVRTEPACSVELSRLESELGRVTLRSCEAEERRAWLHVERRGREPFVVPVLADAVWIARYTETDLDGDALVDWAVEVVARDSHDTSRELVVLPGRLSTALHFELASPLETWWVGGTGAASLWFARTNEGRLEARALRWSGDAFVPTPGWVARSPEPLPKLRAERRALTAGATTAYAAEPQRYWAWFGFLDAEQAKQASSAYGFTLTATSATPPDSGVP